MRVFISHGHDNEAKLMLKDFIARINHEPVILGEQPDRQGKTIIEALENVARNCEFAIILFTRDDRTMDGTYRARQNVIHECGFFQGLLGRIKVLLVVKKGVETPSNLAGLYYLEYAKDIKEIFSDVEEILAKSDSSVKAREVPSIGDYIDKIHTQYRSWIQDIAEELQYYVELPPETFFQMIYPTLKRHGDARAEQLESFKRYEEKFKEGKIEPVREIKNEADMIMALAPIHFIFSIDSIERVVTRCRNALTLIEKSKGATPEFQEQVKNTILRMFNLTPNKKGSAE